VTPDLVDALTRWCTRVHRFAFPGRQAPGPSGLWAEAPASISTSPCFGRTQTTKNPPLLRRGAAIGLRGLIFFLSVEGDPLVPRRIRGSHFQLDSDCAPPEDPGLRNARCPTGQSVPSTSHLSSELNFKAAKGFADSLQFVKHRSSNLPFSCNVCEFCRRSSLEILSDVFG
jgi:hypothetical protein